MNSRITAARRAGGFPVGACPRVFGPALAGKIGMRPAIILSAMTVFLSSWAVPSQAAFVISKGDTVNVTCDRGTCSATGSDAVLSTKDLTKLLKISGVTLIAGSDAKDLLIKVPFAWANQNSLTLQADQSVIIEQPLTVEAKAALTINPHSGGPSGEFVLGTHGRIDFWDLGTAFAINTDPYVLEDDVAKLGHDMSVSRTGRFALAADYDAAQDGTYNFPPMTVTFSGQLEGLGHTISNFSLKDLIAGDHVGFMNTLGGGTVRYLTFANAKIIGGEASYVGALFGVGGGSLSHVTVSGLMKGKADSIVGGIGGSGGGVVSDCHVRVTALSKGGRGNAGGLFGEVTGSGGSVSDCDSEGRVEGGNAAGGLVGNNLGVTLSNCHSSSKVQAGFLAGGLAGQSGADVEHCYATGSVQLTGSNGYAGGLIGHADHVYWTYATGNVTASDHAVAGGLLGVNGDVRYSYARGTVTAGANSTVGGLLGQQTGLLSYSYSTGAVSAGSGSTVGGLVGIDSQPPKDILHTYWDLDTSGISDPSRGAGSPANDYGIEGLDTAQFLSALPNGFDTTNWAQDPDINGGYPYLKSMPPKK